jgi:hypothetical protein
MMDILAATLITALLLLVEHWFPWRQLVKREMDLLARYVIGTLGLLVPFAILLASWQQWQALIALASIVVAGGLSVMGAYAVDGWIDAKTSQAVLTSENLIARGVIDGQEQTRD